MRHICDMVEAYKEGQLSREERVEFERHLGSCTICAAELEWLEELDKAFARVPSRRTPRGMEREVLSALGFERRPAWSGALGWVTATMVGAWLAVLPVLFKTFGVRSLVPAARGLADLPSCLSNLLQAFRTFLHILKPIAVTAEALLKALNHMQFPLAVTVVLLLTMGFTAGLYLWHNLRGACYARSDV